jgi:predicted Co/Zn/Cd cation transporter (cation efflux family)
MTWEHTPLIQVNLIQAAVTLAGVVLNARMCLIALRRKRLVESDPREEQIARLTMHRAVRQEAAFFVVQVLLLGVSLWALLAVIPAAPDGAVWFYGATQAARTLTSLILAAVSTLDMKDRKRISAMLDALTPADAPPTKIG